MSVIDLRAKGGTVTEPTKDNENPSGAKGPDPVKELEQALYRADAYRAFRERAGLVDDKGKTEEKVGIDSGSAAVVKALAEQNTAMMALVVEGLKTKPSDPLLTHLLEDLKAEKEAREQLQSSNPYEAMNQSLKQYSEMMGYIKKDLGLPDTMKTQISDMSSMLQLEQMKIQHEERKQQWETERQEGKQRWEAEMAERRRRWEIEDKKWFMDMEIKKAELEKSSQNRDKMFGELGDLGKAMLMGIAEDRAAAGQGISRQVIQPPPTQYQPAPPETERPAANFVCDGCQSPLAVPSHIKSFTCPKCGKEHDLSEAQEEALQEV